MVSNPENIGIALYSNISIIGSRPHLPNEVVGRERRFSGRQMSFLMLSEIALVTDMFCEPDEFRYGRWPRNFTLYKNRFSNELNVFGDHIYVGGSFVLDRFDDLMLIMLGTATRGSM